MDVEFVKAQAERARELEQVYVASREVHGAGWSVQAQRMLEQVRENRLYFEGRLRQGDVVGGRDDGY